MFPPQGQGAGGGGGLTLADLRLPTSPVRQDAFPHGVAAAALGGSMFNWGLCNPVTELNVTGVAGNVNRPGHRRLDVPAAAFSSAQFIACATPGLPAAQGLSVSFLVGGLSNFVAGGTRFSVAVADNGDVQSANIGFGFSIEDAGGVPVFYTIEQASTSTITKINTGILWTPASDAAWTTGAGFLVVIEAIRVAGTAAQVSWRGRVYLSNSDATVGTGDSGMSRSTFDTPLLDTGERAFNLFAMNGLQAAVGGSRLLAGASVATIAVARITASIAPQVIVS